MMQVTIFSYLFGIALIHLLLQYFERILVNPTYFSQYSYNPFLKVNVTLEFTSLSVIWHFRTLLMIKTKSRVLFYLPEKQAVPGNILCSGTQTLYFNSRENAISSAWNFIDPQNELTPKSSTNQYANQCDVI